MTRQSEHRRRAPILVLALAYASTVCSAVIAITGGARVEVLGVTLAAGYPYRSMLIACVAFALYLFRWRRSLGPDTLIISSTPAAIVSAIARSRWTAAVIALAVLIAGLQWGSTIAGGSDSYGYVSQASLWRHAHLVTRLDIINHVPWPEAGRTFAPLGYRPGPIDGTIVPTYPPGFPLLMALGQTLMGYCGAFVVVPLCGAAFVWLTYVLGRRLFDSSAVALGAAILVATSPVFIFQLVQPMSDVPAAAAWTLALVLMAGGRPVWAGLAMGATLAIRPNLVLLPVSLLAWSLVRDALMPASGRRFGATLRLFAGLLPALAGIMCLNEYLYGSPFVTGYGSANALYAWGSAARNLANYTSWLIEVETPIVLLAVLYFVAPRHFPQRVPYPRLFLGSTIAAVVLSYVFYLSFDAWWYLRFLLPVWPILMLLTVAGIDLPLRIWLRPFRPVAIAVCVCLLALYGAEQVRRRALLDFDRGERQYLQVARFVAAHTDPRAVIISLQYSGSIRHYADRLTMRFDWLDPRWLDRAVDHLTSIGRRPYFVLQAPEIDPFRQRFAAASRLGSLNWKPTAVLEAPNFNVFVFDPGERGSREPIPIPLDVAGHHGVWHCDPPAPLATSLR